MVEDNAVFDCYVSSKNNNLLIPFSDTIVYESKGENRYSKNVKAYKWVGYDYYDTYDSDMDTVAVGDSYDDYMDFSNPYREVTVGKFVAEYKNKVTYFGVSEEPAPFKKAKNAVDSEGFAGKKFYARFNPKALLNMKSFKENEDKDYMKDAKNIINLFDYAELSTEGKGKASLRVVMNDKNVSPLEILAENLLELFEKYTN